MNFFSNISTKIASVISSVRQAISGERRRSEAVHKSVYIEESESTAMSGGRAYAVIQRGIAGAIAANDAIATVYLHGVGDEVIKALSELGLESMRDALEPVSRSGKTQASLFTRQIPGGYEIASSAESAYALLSGTSMSSGVPSVQALMDWMDLKPESFGDLSPKQARSMAYAIQNSIRTGKGRGSSGESTIMNLPPYGERSYDYVSVAMAQMEPAFLATGMVAAVAIEEAYR